MRFSQADADVVTGFTSPTTIYERMRRMDGASNNLNADVLAHVAEGPFKAAWRGWYAEWKTFFARTMDEKVSNVFHTDDLSAEVDKKEAELEGFRQEYPKQRGPDGLAVPPPSQPQPVPQGPGELTQGGLPWYFWVMATLAAGGLAYVGYLKVQELRAKRKTSAEDLLPTALGDFLGPRLKTGGARDPDAATLIALAKDPAAMARMQAFAYRPYQHPHVVAVRPAPRYEEIAHPPPPYRDPHEDAHGLYAEIEPYEEYEPVPRRRRRFYR